MNLILIIALALIDVVLSFLFIKLYGLFKNQQVTIIMLKAEIEHYRRN